MQPAPPPPTVHELVCAALRGEHPAWPQGADEAWVGRTLEHAALHGVGALLHSQLDPSDWPAPILRTLREEAMQQAMWELRHQQVLAQVLVALKATGVQPVLVKGTALAYSLYADPVLRTRADTDLLIPAVDRHRVQAALASLGFERAPGVSGEFASYQANYTLRPPGGGDHTLDLHWKINNSEVLSHLFTYDELAHDAQPLPQIRADALGASRVHSLLLACMHRATHRQNPYFVNGESHHEANRLIWLHDIHLLAGALNSREWQEFIRLAAAKGLGTVCLDGMQNARTCFHTDYPADVWTSLRAQPGCEPADRYLASGKLRQQWMDFRALEGGAARARFLRELFFPAPDYMHSKYPGARPAWLPWLYLRRVVEGLARAERWKRTAS